MAILNLPLVWFYCVGFFEVVEASIYFLKTHTTNTTAFKEKCEYVYTTKEKLNEIPFPFLVFSD